MRRTDAVVHASLLVVKLPILASQWLIKPPQNATPEETEIAKFVHANLNGMTNPWTEVLEQILTYLEFGYAVFEKVFRLGSDGKFHWKKWGPRGQQTIERWNTERDGGLQSVTQSVTDLGTGAYRMIDLAIDRLIVFIISFNFHA